MGDADRLRELCWDPSTRPRQKALSTADNLTIWFIILRFDHHGCDTVPISVQIGVNEREARLTSATSALHLPRDPRSCKDPRNGPSLRRP